MRVVSQRRRSQVSFGIGVLYLVLVLAWLGVRLLGGDSFGTALSAGPGWQLPIAVVLTISGYALWRQAGADK